jgi:hypothetical protein
MAVAQKGSWYRDHISDFWPGDYWPHCFNGFCIRGPGGAWSCCRDRFARARSHWRCILDWAETGRQEIAASTSRRLTGTNQNLQTPDRQARLALCRPVWLRSPNGQIKRDAEPAAPVTCLASRAKSVNNYGCGAKGGVGIVTIYRIFGLAIIGLTVSMDSAFAVPTEAPGPIAGIGLPALALIGGAYWAGRKLFARKK